MITITDPVQRVQYVCSRTKICRKFEYHQPPQLRRLSGLELGKNHNFTVEDLGSSTISGLAVRGKHITRVIPEGQLGNDRAFTTTEEAWRSEDLDLDVKLQRSDPRTGTHTTTLTEVDLGEPDPAYFQIPEGYSVTDAPAPPMMRAGRGSRPATPAMPETQ
jgi:hypothetical protein